MQTGNSTARVARCRVGRQLPDHLEPERLGSRPVLGARCRLHGTEQVGAAGSAVSFTRPPKSRIGFVDARLTCHCSAVPRQLRKVEATLARSEISGAQVVNGPASASLLRSNGSDRADLYRAPRSLLHVTQSAISHHLASLGESSMQATGDARPRGIGLEKGGGILYRHAEAILRHVEFAEQDAISALDVPSAPRDCIGFSQRYLLAAVSLRVIRAGTNRVSANRAACRRCHAWLLRERLVNGQLDIASPPTPINPSAAVRSNRSCWRNCLRHCRKGMGRPFGSRSGATSQLLLPGPESVSRQVAEEALTRLSPSPRLAK